MGDSEAAHIKFYCSSLYTQISDFFDANFGIRSISAGSEYFRCDHVFAQFSGVFGAALVLVLTS